MLKITPLPSKKQKENIIVANHTNILDAFVMTATLSYKSFFRYAPFATMTANTFYKPLWLRPFAFLVGSFPAHQISARGPRYGVDGAIHAIHEGYTLIMFPEGKRTHGMRAPAKPGISWIIDKVPDTKIFVARIKWEKSAVTSIRFAEYSGSHYAEDILDAVYAL